MLNSEEQAWVYRYGYVPEHLPWYVQSVSAAQPFLHEQHLCYVKDRHLVFVGYPLPREHGGTERAFESACRRFLPRSVTIIAESLPEACPGAQTGSFDRYYALDLPLAGVKSDRAYMVRRALRELTVVQGRFGAEHERIVDLFVASHELDAGHVTIFRRIGSYLDRSPSAVLIEARRGGELVAFTVADLGSQDCGFYLFHFRTPRCAVPGSGDLLLHEMAQLAERSGKRRVNLGLGVNQGVTRFKESWGGRPFLDHLSSTIHLRPRGLSGILSHLHELAGRFV